ncbi:MAG: FAD-dependent oxidoreductase [Chloroflexota bacterium]|nr:FAD-dependent oxidoreductase [Chloroflexota bacterium]
MAVKPVLMTVDDDPEVLRAVERDLRTHYGNRYRVLAADSGAEALSTVEQLTVRNQPVALFLVDQRMPRMTGVEFLEKAIDFFPEAKRVLLTAYADTDAAIRAINTARVDYYLMKPWDPPDERLYPVVDDLLDDWQAGYRPAFEGIRIVSHRWSARAHNLKDFLARNQIPYQVLDIETDEQAQKLVELAGAGMDRLPLVLFPDGTHMVDPEPLEVAGKQGIRTRAGTEFYDLVIVGGGPAGLAAAVYGGSEGLRTLMVEREAPGGQAGTSSRIENYLGFPSGLSGAELARRALAQATRFGVEVVRLQEVSGVKVNDPYRTVRFTDGSEVTCYTLLVATGVQYRKLDAPGVDRLLGAGVFYGAAMTEAMACKGQHVYIVGGANSAAQAALYFVNYAEDVTLLVRGNSLAAGMSQYLVDRIESSPTIHVRLNSSVVAVDGDTSLKSITIADSSTGRNETVDASAMFIFIGAMPRTDWLDGVVQRDRNGFVLSGPDLMQDGQRPKGWTRERDPFLLETNVPGIFVAGDVRHDSVKRIASAVGEGAMAVALIHKYLAEVR